MNAVAMTVLREIHTLNFRAGNKAEVGAALGALPK